MRRPSAVAGTFYPARPEELTRQLHELMAPAPTRRSVVAVVVPHAGIMYSGPVAGAVYERLEFPPSAILLGPNHYGRGSPMAIFSEGSWETPLGEVAVDAELAAALCQACPGLEKDAEAHRLEHSLEVQLPFLQQRAPGLRIVPIIMSVGRLGPVEALGRALATVVAARQPRPLLLASTDFTHYEPDSAARLKDRKAIDRILALDPRGLYDTVRRERISMCGYEPTVAVLTALGELGARDAELVRYATSGDITGDRASVVGYAGILLW